MLAHSGPFGLYSPISVKTLRRAYGPSSNGEFAVEVDGAGVGAARGVAAGPALRSGRRSRPGGW